MKMLLRACAWAALLAAVGRCLGANRAWCDRVCPPRPSPRPATALPPGYLLAPDVGAYKLYTTPVNWQQANETCRGDGAHLAVPDSQEELDILMRLRHAIKDVHIGIHDFDQEGVFTTVTGHNLNAFQRGLWYKGYPKKSTDRNAGALWSNAQIWDDKNWSKKLFLCELERKFN